MKQRTLSIIGVFTLFLIGTVFMGSFVVGMEIEPEEIDITIEETIFVKGYMKRGLIFTLGGWYDGDVNVKATFTHLRSGCVFDFNFDDTLYGLVYIFPMMKKMPAGLYDIEVRIMSL